MLLHFHNLTCTCNQPNNLYQNLFLYFSQFSPPFPTILVHKIILTIPTNTQFLYTSVILHLLIFPYNLLNNHHQKYFPTSAIEPFQAASRDQGARKSCEDWNCVNLPLLPQSMESDNRAYDHWLLIAQAQKIGVLQLVVSDEDACNGNGKPYNSPTPIPPNPFSLLPYPTNTIARTHISLETSCNPLSYLTFLYTIHVPLHPYA